MTEEWQWSERFSKQTTLGTIEQEIRFAVISDNGKFQSILITPVRAYIISIKQEFDYHKLATNT